MLLGWGSCISVYITRSFISYESHSRRESQSSILLVWAYLESPARCSPTLQSRIAAAKNFSTRYVFYSAHDCLHIQLYIQIIILSCRMDWCYTPCWVGRLHGAVQGCVLSNICVGRCLLQLEDQCWPVLESSPLRAKHFYHLSHDSSVLVVLKALDTFTVCIGNDDAKFSDLAESCRNIHGCIRQKLFLIGILLHFCRHTSDCFHGHKDSLNHLSQQICSYTCWR